MLKTTDGTQYKRIPGLPGDRMPTTGFQKKRALYTATGGETTINLALLSPSLSCIPGMNQIAIKRSSGGALITGVDFYETNSTTITFPSSDPLIAGEIVEISQEAMVTGIAALTARPDCYTATATAGQTSIICDFSWPYNLNSGKAIGGVSLYINGVLQTRGIDFTEVNLGTANTNQIDLSLGGPLVGGENIIAVPTYQAIDTSAATSGFYGSAYSGLQSMMAAGAQNFVDQSTDMISVPNTTIVGRAKIPNLANDLRASFGIERISVQQIMQLQNEFGPNGEPVFAATNDDRGLVRFVGSGWSTLVAQNGPFAYNSGTLNDYFEITFYGTHLNLLIAADAADLRMSIDGGLESANIVTSQSVILYNRGYSANIVQAAVPTQTLGIHTIKFKIGTAGDVIIHGFEILNSNASNLINVNPGTAYINGLKVTKPLSSSVTYSTGVTGARGGRIVRYLNSDGTIGQSFQPVDSAAATLALANHINEEVARVYHWREFGAGRVSANDDFSYFPNVNVQNKAFTLDDGTTSLVGFNVRCGANIAETLDVINSSGNGYLTLTFIGTGLDVVLSTDSSTRSFTAVYVDGTSIGSISKTGSTGKETKKIVSGLPYGTHTVKLENNSTGLGSPALHQFIVYQPKKPTVPSTAIELCDYNVMADYVASTVSTRGTVATGSLRKLCMRENIYVGTWITNISTDNNSGWYVASNASGSSYMYTFFGTGIEVSTITDATVLNQTFYIDDVATGTTAANLIQPGTGLSMTAGVLTGTSSVGGGLRVKYSGLPLGKHTIKVVNNTTSYMYADALDIITPIHSYKSNLYADLQNSLSVGSQSVMDSRKISMIKEITPSQKAWAQAIGIMSDPTTTSGFSTPVPVPDMSLTIKTSGGSLFILGVILLQMDAAGTTSNYGGILLYMDGVACTTYKFTVAPVVNGAFEVTDQVIVPVSPGVHKVDMYWGRGSAGTLTASATRRILTAREL